jgi:LCP family protein required for cell wall assembly
MSRLNFRAPLAAALSFLVPGLGQAYNRQFWLAALFVLPFVFTTGLVVAAAGRGNSAASAFLDVRVLGAVIVLDVALFGWRIAAIVQAHVDRGWDGFKRWTSWVTILLVAVTIAMHAVPAWYATATIGTLTAVSRGGTGAGGIFAGFPHLVPGPSSSVEPTPRPTPVAITSRVTVLLVGIDYIPARKSTYLTDTMIVATIDPRAGIDLISVPRDTYGAPLGDGRVYNAKLNGLLARAQREPGNYPLGGPETLKAAVGELVGMKIDYIAAIEVLGFKDAIDALGGIDITVERAINDPTYWDEYDNKTGFYLPAGDYHMDGHTAVGYARSRKGAGDSDFTRAARQQQILVALLRQLTAGNLILNLPNLLGIVGDSVASDVPIELLPHIAQALQRADLSNIERLVIEHPLVRNDTLTDGTYILIPDIDAIRAAVRELITFQPGATPEPDL